ncbi:MAG: hypothetical protein GF418_06815 [Chitinivibrionales bacterium]|nr:hypothetical protein [Chitinivibrionales bacterium]MBD3395321.1 hypothetical protein [Chitinivibrionales bacterium]
MDYRLAHAGRFRVIDIQQDIAVTSDISELRVLVREQLAGQAPYIALRFTRESYLCSGNVTVLVACFEMIRERRGELAIIDPNPIIRHLLTVIDLDGAIRVVDTEEDLARAGHAAASR